MDDLDPFNEGIESKGRHYPMVVLTNKKLLVDDTYTDLIIKVGNETVTAHAAIVSCRCTEILGFQDQEKAKKSKKKLEVKVGGVASAAIMSKVLEFLYTGMVDFPKISDKEILHLTAAARVLKLDRLCYLCERWLREHMTIESVFHLLKAATDLKEERVKGFCLQFALQHYNDFISNKDGIYILGIELFQEVVAAFQTNPTPPKEMRSEDCPDTLLNDFQRMYDQMPYSDGIITLGNDNIRYHKAVLAAHSDVFVSSMFRDEASVRISANAFKAMLRFLYYGEDKIEPLPACELVAFSRTFKLASLNRICEDKIRCSIARDTVLPILAIAYLAAEGKQDLVEELKNKCFPFILQNLSSVDFSMIKAFNPLMTVDLLLELQSAWKKGDYGLGQGIKISGSSSSKLPSGGASSSAVSSGSSSDRGDKEPKHRGPPQNIAPPPPSRGKEAPSAGGLLGAQRSANARPTPPPRGVTRAPSMTQNLPPPVFGDAAPAPSPATRTESSSDLSGDDSATTPKGSKASATGGKNKKEEEKRKKDEAKRLAKEKKERAKMEKKFKPGTKGSKEIF